MNEAKTPPRGKQSSTQRLQFSNQTKKSPIDSAREYQLQPKYQNTATGEPIHDRTQEPSQQNTLLRSPIGHFSPQSRSAQAFWINKQAEELFAEEKMVKTIEKAIHSSIDGVLSSRKLGKASKRSISELKRPKGGMKASSRKQTSRLKPAKTSKTKTNDAKKALETRVNALYTKTQVDAVEQRYTTLRVKELEQQLRHKDATIADYQFKVHELQVELDGANRQLSIHRAKEEALTVTVKDMEKAFEKLKGQAAASKVKQSSQW